MWLAGEDSNLKQVDYSLSDIETGSRRAHSSEFQNN